MVLKHVLQRKKYLRGKRDNCFVTLRKIIKEFIESKSPRKIYTITIFLGPFLVILFVSLLCIGIFFGKNFISFSEGYILLLFHSLSDLVRVQSLFHRYPNHRYHSCHFYHQTYECADPEDEIL